MCDVTPAIALTAGFFTVTGGRSRLHLFDLGSFEKTKVSGLTLSAVGNVIVSIFNAHKHLPCR